MDRATVESYDSEQGFGVLVSPYTPGGCFVSFSAIQDNTHLVVGTEVFFEFVAAEQDGYRYRATTVWTDEPQAHGIAVTRRPTSAYRSTFRIGDVTGL